jgi:hypothetical protein
MDSASELESITTNNYEYVHDGNRRFSSLVDNNFLIGRYHGIEGNRYPLPNDYEEVLRLDKLHYMF